MKKNFFKKLSFVVALAMTISTVAPAAGAFAATAPKLNSTKKYLHLDVEDLNDYNFNITSTKGKGWNYLWETSDEDVAVVDESNGVTTATGVGTATITVFITDKDGEEIGDASATVVVRDNIKEVTVENNPTDKKLTVGTPFNYNIDYKTVSGSTTATSSVTRWTVTPADGATIDAKGVFTATKSGKYTVTAVSFQSTAKYDVWNAKADKAVTDELVLASATTEVTVPVGIVGVKQVNKTKFTVEFDTDVSATLTKDNAFVYQVLNGKQITTGTEKIKEVKFDGKKATVELYGNIVAKTVYNFVYGDATGTFTGAKNDITEVAGIVFDDFTVATDSATGVDLTSKVNAVNADGVVILSGAEVAQYLTFTYGGDYANGWLSGTNAFVTKNGYSAIITAKYTNFVLDSASNTYKTVTFEDGASATGVTTAVNTSTMQYVVKKAAAAQDSSAAWATTGFSVPAGDGNYYIHSRYKSNNDANTWLYPATDYFTYVSTDVDKLVINGYNLYPIAQGVVTVIVKKGTDVVGTFEVTIVTSRAFATATPDTQMVTLGNFDFADAADEESKNVVIWAKDSMNEGIADVAATAEVVGRPSGTGIVDPTVSFAYGTGDNAGKITATVKAVGATKGSYNIKITTSSSALNSASKTLNVYAVVVDSAASEGLATRWALELSTGEVDLKKVAGEKNVTVKVYGYNKNNARIDVLDPTEYSLTIKKGDTAIKTLNGDTPTTTNIPVASASGTALSFVDLDTYVVTAFAEIVAPATTHVTGRGDGVYISAASFVVKDTTTKTYSQDTLSVKLADATTVAAAVKKAFNFKVNDVDMESATGIVWQYVYSKGGALTTDAGAGAVAAGENLFVSAVKVTVSFDSNVTDVTYTINVGKTVTITN